MLFYRKLVFNWLVQNAHRKIKDSGTAKNTCKILRPFKVHVSELKELHVAELLVKTKVISSFASDLLCSGDYILYNNMAENDKELHTEK